MIVIYLASVTSTCIETGPVIDDTGPETVIVIHVTIIHCTHNNYKMEPSSSHANNMIAEKKFSFSAGY